MPKRTDLSIFAEMTLSQGGHWYTLCESENYTLCSSKSVYWDGNHKFFGNPVYQIFENSTGARIYTSTNYTNALYKYDTLINEGR